MNDDDYFPSAFTHKQEDLEGKRGIFIELEDVNLDDTKRFRQSPEGKVLGRENMTESTETHHEDGAELQYKEFQEKFQVGNKSDSDPTQSLNGSPEDEPLPRQPKKALPKVR